MSLNRYAKRRDENEPEIVEALEKAGASVFRLDQPGDLLVGYLDRNYLLEVKVPGAPTRFREGLTETQARFQGRWRGQFAIVTTAAQALGVVGAK